MMSNSQQRMGEGREGLSRRKEQHAEAGRQETSVSSPHFLFHTSSKTSRGPSPVL